MRAVLLSLLMLAGPALAQDISNPLRLLAVADREANIIDIIDVNRGKTVHRFETALRPDHVLITPHAPILVYFNEAEQQAVFYNLETRLESGRLALPVTPRHVVLDSTGGKAGVSDSVAGGFALVSLYGRQLDFHVADFPPTGDVLFDPNEVDIYYSDSARGELGILDSNVQQAATLRLTGETDQALSSPSRSLDARHIYVANQTSGEVYALNAFSRVVFKTFEVGARPARPYTTPQGSFLYLNDLESGRFMTIEQGQFSEYADVSLAGGIDLVAVGRFDRFNVFLSTTHRRWFIWDNLGKSVAKEGEFRGTPLDARGAADGKTAWIAFTDLAEVAMIDLEHQAVRYIPATENGAGSFAIGLSNNVCH